jgi:putative transposase
MPLSYKYRLYPTQTQQSALAEMLQDFCWLYNAALEQRIDAQRKRGISLGYTWQANELKAVRELCYGFERWSFSAEQQVLRRLDKAFKAFFRRCKAGEKPGFPRFRAGEECLGALGKGSGSRLAPEAVCFS